MKTSGIIPKFDKVISVDFRGMDKASISIARKREFLHKRYEHFASQMIDRFIDHLISNGTKGSTKKGQAFAFEKVLRFLSIQMCDTAMKVKTLIHEGKFNQISPDDAHYLEILYEKHLHSVYQQGLPTIANKVQNANQALRLMFEAGVWPYTLRIPYVFLPNWKNKSRPSLLDSIVQIVDPHVDINTSIHSKNAAISAALNFLGLPYSGKPETIVHSVVSGEQECLRRIRNELSEQIQTCYQNREFAKTIFAGIDSQKYLKIKEWFLLAWPPGFKPDNYHKKSTRCNPFTSDEDVLSSFLAIVKLFYFCGQDSLIHKYTRAQTSVISIYLRSLKSGLVKPKLIEKGLGSNAFDDFFCPSAQLVVSTLYLLMADTGLNLSPSRELLDNSIQPDDNKNWLSIASWKDRANGTLIYENIYVSKDNEHISSGLAIQKLISFHKDADYFKFPDHFDRHLIFYCMYGILSQGETYLTQPAENKCNSIFESIVRGAFGTGLHIFPSQMRVSILLIQRASSGGLNSASLKASHKNINTTHRHYAGNSSYIFTLDNSANIREFQNNLERIALHNLRGSGQPQEINELLEKTGLGTLCAIKTTVNSEASCVTYDKCPGCPSFRVSTDSLDLAKLMQWVRCLQEHKDYILMNRGDSWETRWIFWTELLKEIEEIGPRSAWASDLAKAKELLKTLPPFNPPAIF